MTGGHRRILVVEDDPETAGQLVEQLTTSGYQVDLATCGNDALSRGSASEYAVITIEAAPTVMAKSAAIWGSSESVTRTCAWLAKATTASSTIERVCDFGGFSGAVGGTKGCSCGLRLCRSRWGAALTGGMQGALYA